MKKAFKLSGLCCANCASKMEREISKIKGVNSCCISIMTTRMTIEAEDQSIDELCQKAFDIVLKYEPEISIKRVL